MLKKTVKNDIFLKLIKFLIILHYNQVKSDWASATLDATRLPKSAHTGASFSRLDIICGG